MIDTLLYHQITGCLTYLSICTRPDTNFCVKLLTRGLSARTAIHLQMAKRVLRCLKGSIN
ncbi:unnamed protein product [Discosporangium mesarthrocarpum]